jgi:prophage antirepressor-like protein
MTFVTESGLYALIFKARQDKAKIFRRWVTGEVLPAIRKTGTFTTAPVLKDYAEIEMVEIPPADKETPPKS